ncbi:MAG TPA: hypothetical protein VK858_07285 [Longimicrobiales bacterium]|nr:hypothetical protein [Longimicrobiales bacterium]
MSHRPFTLTILAAVPFLPACADGGSPGRTAVEWYDSAGIPIVVSDISGLPECTLSPEPRVEIGNRPGDPDHELYRVFGASRLGDGRIAVVDQGSQTLRFYSGEGEFLSAAGGQGGGPGEFQNAFLLWRMAGDTLWVGDYRPWEFEVFSPEGSWTRMTRPAPWYPNPPRAYAILADGRQILGSEDILSRSETEFRRGSIDLMLHGSDGALVDTLTSVPSTRWGKTIREPDSPWLYPWFDASAEVAARGDQLVLGHGSLAELRLYDVSDTLTLRTIVRWRGIDRSVSPDDVSAVVDAVRAQYADLDPGMRERLVAPLVHEDRPVADSFPSMTTVLPGVDDALWIKQYTRPAPEPGPAVWLRFEPSGEARCRLHVPDGVDVYEFGPDYMLGETTDEMGVESVVLYALGKARQASP